MRFWSHSFCLPVIIFVFIASNSVAQVSNIARPFPTYYYDYKLANPAFVGTKGKHVINTVYSGVPSHSVHQIYGSYERSIKEGRSGIGGIFMYDQYNSFRKGTHIGGLFSHRISLGDASGLRFGTQVFYQSSTYDYSYYRYVVDGDPLILDEKTKERTASFDLGVVFYSKAITLGGGVKNAIEANYLVRSVNLLATRKFEITTNLKFEPSLFFETTMEGYDAFAVNTTAEAWKWLMFGAGYTTRGKGLDDISFNIGLNIKDRVQIVTHVYSSANQSLADYTDTFVNTMIRVTLPESKTP
jgi:type IX secretion system PorP/SprF family membrane protein